MDIVTIVGWRAQGRSTLATLANFDSRAKLVASRSFHACSFWVLIGQQLCHTSCVFAAARPSTWLLWPVVSTLDLFINGVQIVRVFFSQGSRVVSLGDVIAWPIIALSHLTLALIIAWWTVAHCAQPSIGTATSVFLGFILHLSAELASRNVLAGGSDVPQACSEPRRLLTLRWACWSSTASSTGRPLVARRPSCPLRADERTPPTLGSNVVVACCRCLLLLLLLLLWLLLLLTSPSSRSRCRRRRWGVSCSFALVRTPSFALRFRCLTVVAR